MTPEIKLILGLLSRNLELYADKPPSHSPDTHVAKGNTHYEAGWRDACNAASDEIRRARDTLLGHSDGESEN